MYRIADEALTNVVRHGEAAEAHVALRRKGRRVSLEVRDDGKGFDTEQPVPNGHVGLQGMRERATMVGGYWRSTAPWKRNHCAVRSGGASMIRVLIVDDQEVVREGLRAILGTVPGLEVVGVAGNGAEASEMAARLQPDVVLMDLNMPIMNGVEATRAITTASPEVRVLVLTTYDAEEWVLDAIRAGAAGYLLKDAPRERLIEAIKGTVAGRTHVDPGVAGSLLARAAAGESAAPSAVADALSDRELDVLSFWERACPTLTLPTSSSSPRAPFATT